MRIAMILFAVLLTSSLQAATGRSVALEFKVKNPESSRTTVIYTVGKKKWECKTELRPRPTTMGESLDQRELNELSKTLHGKKVESDCHDKVFAIDRTTKPKTSFAGCMTDPKLASFINELDKACLR
jgi:hypothetical protein